MFSMFSLTPEPYDMNSLHHINHICGSKRLIARMREFTVQSV